MDIEVCALESLDAVRSIATEWQQLHDSAHDGNPFNGPDWPLTWLEHFTTSGPGTPLVLTARSGGKLMGVAPLHRRRELRGALRLVTPIGVGVPWVMPFELPTVLAHPDAGRDVCRAFVGYLCEQSATWDIARVMFGAAAGWLEPQWLANPSVAVLVRRLRADVVLPVDTELDPYTGRRNLKESLRRARNRLTRDFGADGWSVVRHDSPDDLDVALTRLFALHRSRAEMDDAAPRHSDALAVPAVERYLRDVLVRSARSQGARVYELRIGDDVVAAQLVLRTCSSTYFSLSGIRSRAWPYSAVTYLQSLAVADARADGHRAVHLSIGPNQSKMRWTDRVEQHPEFWLVAPAKRSRAAYLLAEGVATYLSLHDARTADVDVPRRGLFRVKR